MARPIARCHRFHRASLKSVAMMGWDQVSNSDPNKKFNFSREQKFRCGINSARPNLSG
jgi:hypothetical protein